MILEIAVLDVVAGREAEFEESFADAQRIIRSMRGYLSHELKRCVEQPSRYVLLVNWQRIEDHTEGFRSSPEYQEWRKLLHHYYDPPPQVAHYRDLAS
jgi:heme-degrading monooxygenase HmoA